VNQLDNDMTPRQIVDYLNKHIVGQQDAKRAIAIAMVWSFMMFLHPE
jgi:ATP-dependent protease HslVU (ClpYQ) ATPase subunit